MVRAGSEELRAALEELLTEHGAERLSRVMEEWCVQQGLARSGGALEGVYTHTVTKERVYTCPFFAMEDALWEEGDTTALFDMQQLEEWLNECEAQLAKVDQNM